MLKVGLLCLLYIVSEARADNWAVLVAGSNGWGNYRHQADICHAYQILKARGFREDNIITLMYDDIANNSDNPLMGQIINQPYGPDVYKGVKIDYRGDDLTPENFLSIISGDADAMKEIGTGRVLESGPDDYVFINFVDHGGVGILCFPNDNLMADDLENTLRKMASKKSFKKLLFYVEACEAGSMFDNILEEHNNILVSTASAKDESSMGWYCSNPQIDSCLGDLYSISWMQHMDKLLGSSEGNTETLWHQYDVVRTLVNESHVQLYGDFQLGQDTIDEFFGKASVTNSNGVVRKPVTHERFSDSFKGIPSREVELYTAQLRLQRAPQHLKQIRKQELDDIVQKREYADKTMNHIFKMASKGKAQLHQAIMESKFSLNKGNYPCYKNLLLHFNKLCFNTAKNNYLLRYLNKFVNMCSLQWVSESEVIQAMKISCSSKTRSLTRVV